jgi:hypothetical protein
MSAYDYYEFYLEAKDLKGLAHVVKISEVRIEEFYNARTRKNDKKIVLKFENRRKSLILNKTQAGAVMDIADTDNEAKWRGVEIVLTGGRAINGKDTVIITSKANSNSIDLMYPADGKNVPIVATVNA